MSLTVPESVTDALEKYASQTGLTVSQFSLAIGLGAAALAGVGVYLSSGKKKNNTPYGPGPKGVPILGNAADLPKTDDYKVYASWAKKYGDFIYLTVLGQPIYLISSIKTASELLDKRAMIYSDRPTMLFAQEMVGWKRTPVLTSSLDPRYTPYRKLFHNALRKERVRELAPLQEQSSHTMCKLILDKPDDWLKHIRYCIGAVITKMTYDYDMAPEGDEFVALAEKSADTFSQAAAPGAWLVDIIPWLQYVPTWFPGAGFKRTAAEWKAVNDYLHAKPYNTVKEQMKAGTHGGSVTSRLLAGREGEGELSEEDENRIMWVVGAIYSGGADTTVSALTTFVLAMVLYPEAQRKAQDELDRVIGTNKSASAGGRLPVLADRPRLPYIEALYQEVLRWHPVAPLGVPHRLTTEDKWGAYTVPKGSTVITNIWAMGHTESDSDEFKPERHLYRSGPDAVDPRDYVFGFGRRVCPGKDLADAGVWLAIATLLSAFKFGKKSDGKGGFIDVKEEFGSGIICHPKPFECSITPRTATSTALINHMYDQDA